MSDARVPVRLILADHGSFHEAVVELPLAVLEHYERIIDALREDPVIMSELYVDPRRLVAAFRVGP
jgi:hypothetical protein